MTIKDNWKKLSSIQDSNKNAQETIAKRLEVIEELKKGSLIGYLELSDHKQGLLNLRIGLDNIIETYNNIKEVNDSAQHEKLDDLLVKVETIWNQAGALDNKWLGELLPKIYKLDTQNSYIQELQRKYREESLGTSIKLAVGDILINILSSIDALTLSQFPSISHLVTDISAYRHQVEFKANQENAERYQQSSKFEKATQAKEMEENSTATTSIKQDYLSGKGGEENTDANVRPK